MIEYAATRHTPHLPSGKRGLSLKQLFQAYSIPFSSAYLSNRGAPSPYALNEESYESSLAVSRRILMDWRTVGLPPPRGDEI
mmetsp:Transcript_62937/g.185890  ORF Transcript_62937/g.185890 Transcript_62937/m.185890 type:complete len:82 (+) Transcript_62937:238-483(+)